jgi:tetratricopeptide (TPR) repeat protein
MAMRRSWRTRLLFGTGGTSKARRYVWFGAAAAAVLAAIGAYAGIAAQLSGLPTETQMYWTWVASVVAAIFAFLTSTAGGYALIGDQERRKAIAKRRTNEIYGGVPPRNPLFTNRVEAIGLITATFRAEGVNQGSPRSCAVFGLGGIGKTSVAAEYAFRNRDEYKLVWWIRSEHEASMAEDLARLLSTISDISDFNNIDLRARLGAELSEWSPWLLIFDNAASPEQVRNFWIEGDGHIIVTSRNISWESLADGLISMEILSQRDSVLLLQKHTRTSDDQSAASVADSLGRLPLALVQAAAYVSQAYISLARYSELLKVEMSPLMAAAQPQNYSQTIATTWSMSVAQVSRESPSTHPLLILSAYLSSEDIPRWLVAECDPVVLLGSGLEPLADSVRFDLCIASLRRYSLVSASTDNYSMHRLIQLVIRDSLRESDALLWAKRAILILAAVFPRDPREKATWNRCASLLPHVLTAISHLEERELFEPSGQLLMRVGVYLAKRGLLAPSFDVLSHSFRILELVNPGSLNTAAVSSELARVQHRRAKLHDALACSLRAVRIRESVTGTASIELVGDLTRMGTTFMELSKLDDASSSFERALMIAEQHYGIDDIRLLSILNRMSYLEQRRGNLKSSVGIARRALNIDLRRDQEDPLMRADLNHRLGMALAASGEFAESKVFNFIARDIWLAIGGDDSYDTLKADHAIIDSLTGLGLFDEAIRLAARTIDGFTSFHQSEHPDLAMTLRSQGEAFIGGDRAEEAIEPLERSASIYRDFYGERHPYLTEALIPLGLAQVRIGDFSAASASLSVARSIVEEQYPVEHPTLGRIFDVYGKLEAVRGNTEQSNAYASEAQRILASALQR